jgi:hypothetical protein
MSIVILRNFNKLVWQKIVKRRKVKSNELAGEKQSWANFCCALDSMNLLRISFEGRTSY